MLADLIDKYAWTEEDYDFVWTVAVVEGRTADEVIGLYGGDSARPVGDYYFSQMADLQDFHPLNGLKFHLQVLVHEQCVIAVEFNGWSGDHPEIARRCSAGNGRFFSVYWSVNARYQIVQAIDGKVVAYFDPFWCDEDGERVEGELYPDWMAGVSIPQELTRSASMALMEQQTGLAFDRGWLTEMRPTYRIPDPDWMLRDVPNARML